VVVTGPETPPPPTLVHRPGDAMHAEALLRTGDVLRVELHPAGGYRWSAVRSADPALAETAGEVDASGIARFTVHALRPGSVVLTATTDHVGDPFGPPTRRWTLTLGIEGTAAGDLT
jgi:hypothetical protein